VVPGDLNRVAITLKHFYLAQEPTDEIEAWGRIDRLRISTDENFRQTRQCIGQTLSRAAFEAIRCYTNRFYARHKRLFASRITERRIRDCHGDLHLEHIHVTPRQLHIYDCIEFNDRFRYVDVASDAAFLAMDLDYEGRHDLSRFFAGQMAWALNDAGMPRLMNFYKCYRAYVRGKVESLHSIAPTAPDEERRAAAERARRYFRLALQYAVSGSEPTVLVVMGRIASGKSTVARAMGAELGWEVYSSDYLRKKMAGFPLYERSSAAARVRLYSKAMTKATYDRLAGSAETQWEKGRSVILDATFARRAQRASLARRFRKRGIPWRAVEVQASDAAVRKRLRARQNNQSEVSDARLEDFAMLAGLYEPPNELPGVRRVKVGNSGPLARSVLNTLQGLARLEVDDQTRK
jgi:predicted kinase